MQKKINKQIIILSAVINYINIYIYTCVQIYKYDKLNHIYVHAI